MLENVLAGLVLTGLGAITAWTGRRAVAPDVDPRTAPGIVLPYLAVSLVLIVVGVRSARGASQD